MISLKEHSVNKLDNFISGWTFSNTDICDKLIEYHINNPEKYPGVRGHGVDVTRKASTDCLLTDIILREEYVSNLQTVVECYVNKYPWCNNYAPWNIVEYINLQHYKPNEGYFAWHTERGSKAEASRDRHLVFMTYLNDVTDAGETEWLHQNLQVKPEKGLTVIWPSDWTFTHRGITSPSQEKYIATGWFHFVK